MAGVPPKFDSCFAMTHGESLFFSIENKSVILSEAKNPEGDSALIGRICSGFFTPFASANSVQNDSL
jgi:hypothetical protein